MELTNSQTAKDPRSRTILKNAGIAVWNHKDVTNQYFSDGRSADLL